MTSQYHIDPDKLSLQRFQKSLESREMIPSRVALKNDLKNRFRAIMSEGVNTVGDLTNALKNKQKIEDFSKESGVSADYLTLLKRETGSYFPSPVRLDRFPGVINDAVSKLEKMGVKNSKQLFDRAVAADGRKALELESGLSEENLGELIGLSDLSRLYGVGPVFARMLFDIGIDSVKSMLSLSPEKIVRIYEEQTQKKADFTVHDIRFTLEMAGELEKIDADNPN